LDSVEGEKILHALSARQRVKLLTLLSKQAMNINEIAAALGISQPMASVHIRVLEEAGLVECEYTSANRGSEKRCWTNLEKLVFEFDTEPLVSDELVEEISMPVGLYSNLSIVPTCGLASAERVIGYVDNIQSFMMPGRAEAQIIWFGAGWVEYMFPYDMPSTAEVVGLEISSELCSEAPGTNSLWPSDITVWINGAEVGTWTSPGDLGARKGRLNPDWWNNAWAHYGSLKTWRVDNTGSYIDGIEAGSTNLKDLDVGYQKPMVVRVGNKPDAVHAGGVNIFGKRFGNHPQDIVLKVRYKLRTLGQVTSVVEGLVGAEALENG
jgi:predicted transcriptional regulator